MVHLQSSRGRYSIGCCGDVMVPFIFVYVCTGPHSCPGGGVTEKLMNKVGVVFGIVTTPII